MPTYFKNRYQFLLNFSILKTLFYLLLNFVLEHTCWSKVTIRV